MYLGLDLGTSGVKAVVLNPDSNTVAAQATAPLGISRPHPLWSEQAPDDWWAATQRAVLALDPALRARIRGVGLAGQMHGATLLGRDDRPLRPAILWNDGRSGAECDALERAVPDLRRVTGNICMPGFTAPKLLWVARHEPETMAATRWVLLPKDYLRLRMCGEHASDMSDSAGTLWMDTGARDWSEAMLAACGLSRAQMPSLHEGCAVTGNLRADVAASWGMDRVAVAAGGGDNAAGAAGVGVVRDGAALLSLGTSGVIFAATGAFRPNPAGAVHAFCHCLPGLWHQMSVHLSAAECVAWTARLTGSAQTADVFARAARAAPGPELFLPFLSGERTPHNDPHLRAGFLALDGDTDGDRLCLATLEGVAMALADGLAVLRQAGTAPEEMVVIGGGARSLFWGHIIAALLGVRLLYPEGGETGPALGAARLARAACEGGDPAAFCTPPAIAHAIEPDAALAARLAPKYAAFRQAVSRIRTGEPAR